jgi:putative peptidoglycan lipid II flippase
MTSIPIRDDERHGKVTPPASVSGTVARQAHRATLMMIAFVLLSRVLGIVRDIVIAHLFGQGTETTIYTAAFRVPDILYQLVAGGALAPVFVPVFAEYWAHGKKKDAWHVFSAVICIVAIAAAVMVLVMEVAAVPVARILQPLFTEEGKLQTAALSRILLPAQWCFFVGGLMMGTLNARDRFLIPALGPVIYNAGIIAGGLLMHRHLGIASLTYGAVFGAFVGNFLMPVWDLRRAGAEFRFTLDTLHPGVRKVGRLMLPALLGLSLSQLTFWIMGFFLPDDGRLSALRNANNLTQAPIGVFAQASAIVIFPTISMLAARKEWAEFRVEVSQGIRRILFLTIPASTLMAVLAEPIITLLFANKQHFGPHEVHMAAAALWCYSIGTFAWSAQAVLARGFYSMQDTKTPVVITTAMVVVFTILCFFQRGPQNYLGLALCASSVATLNMLIFLVLLQKRVGGLNVRGILGSGWRITLAALAGSGLAYALVRVLEHALHGGRLASALTLLVAGGAGVGVYAALCYLMRVPELHTVRAMFRRPKNVPDGDSAVAEPAPMD